MSDEELPKIQILDLNEDPVPTRSAYLPEQKSGGSVFRIAIDAILKLVSADDMKGPLQGVAAKAAPSDADNFNLLDNAASWALKTTSWLAIRTAVFVQAAAVFASAATTDIGNANAGGDKSAFISITGTAAITSFGTAAAGTLRIVQFAAALTLTNNANIILPTGANITTAANDVALFRSEGGGVWRCIWYRGSLATSDWVTGTKTTPGMPTPAQVAAAVAALGAFDVTTLFYTGTSNTNTSFPVGSIIVVIAGTTAIARNASVSPALFSSDTAFFTIVGNANAGTALTGTWRNRGKIVGDSTNFYYVIQRTA